MRITAVMLLSGRVQFASESIASFLNQDYEDKHLIVVNMQPKHTIVFENERVHIYNIKSQALPMRARIYAMGLVNEGYVISWDEMSVANSGFLSQITASVEGREWCWLDKEYVFEAGQHLKIEHGSEYSFAFSKTAYDKCGPFQPGINGSSERNLCGKITGMFPGEKTAVAQPNLIRIGSREEREQVAADARCGLIKLQPALSRDWQSVVQVAQSGKREHRLVMVQLGRFGDIISVLPIARHIAENYETPYFMVSEKFAEILEGVSYVKPFVTQLSNEKLGAALSIAKSSFQIVVNCGVWGEGHQQKKATESYSSDAWSNAGYLHRFKDPTMYPVFDRRDKQREAELISKMVDNPQGKPIICVNVKDAISSPCPQCAGVLDEIQKVWSDQCHIVNLAGVRAHRIFDMLGLFDISKCLVTLDSAYAHLCQATDCGIVIIKNPKPWAGTIVRRNLAAETDYAALDLRMIHEGIANCLSCAAKQLPQNVRPVKKVKPRICHLVDMGHETADKLVLARKQRLQESWDRMYEDGSLIPCHFRDYPRNAKTELGDARPLPYLKDLLRFGMNQCRDEDIICWSNDDNGLSVELSEMLRFWVQTYGPCSIFRTEIRGAIPAAGLSPVQVAQHSHEKHVGRDGFSFSKEWLELNWDDIPDAILGASDWDIQLACLIRLQYKIETTNKNIGEIITPAEIPRGYSIHQAHQSAWSLRQHDSPANNWNGQLFKAFAEKRLPKLNLTVHGNLA